MQQVEGKGAEEALRFEDAGGVSWDSPTDWKGQIHGLAERAMEHGFLLFSTSQRGNQVGAVLEGGPWRMAALRRGAYLLRVHGLYGGGSQFGLPGCASDCRTRRSLPGVIDPRFYGTQCVRLPE
jgi:hypothetical protein